jgi:hypothetical protein
MIIIQPRKKNPKEIREEIGNIGALSTAHLENEVIFDPFCERYLSDANIPIPMAYNFLCIGYIMHMHTIVQSIDMPNMWLTCKIRLRT